MEDKIVFEDLMDLEVWWVVVDMFLDMVGLFEKVMWIVYWC